MSPAIRELRHASQELQNRMHSTRTQTLTEAYQYLDDADKNNSEARAFAAWLVQLIHHQPVAMAPIKSWVVVRKTWVHSFLASYLFSDLTEVDYQRISKLQQKFSYADQ